MRSYENLGSNPYNDNYRSESKGSARNYYSGEFDPANRVRGAYGSESSGRGNASRTGDFGSGRDSQAASGYGGTSSYGRSAGSSNYGSGSSNYGSGSANYGSGSSNYGSGSSNYGSSGSNRRYGSNDWDSSNRYGERDAWDRGTDEVKSWFGDDDAERRRRMDDTRDNDSHRSNRSSYGSSSNYGGSGYGSGSSNYGSGSSTYGSGSSGYGSSNYGSGSAGYGSYNAGSGSSNVGSGSNYGSSSYGSGYGSGSSYGASNSNYGNSSNRYSSDWDRNRDRDHDDDRGFFDRAGDEIKSWFGDEEAERRRRMDEMREREYDRDYNNRQRTHTSYGNTYSGPPYSYGSSSRRDYEW